MGREIKFRAWIDGDWVYCSNPSFQSGSMGNFGLYFESSREIHYSDLPKAINQFTGLKDATGKEIYEGDILSIFLINFKKEEIEDNLNTSKEIPLPDIVYATGFVEYDECLTSFRIKYVTKCDSWQSGADSMGLVENNFDHFVIGNIFENEELLK